MANLPSIVTDYVVERVVKREVKIKAKRREVVKNPNDAIDRSEQSVALRSDCVVDDGRWVERLVVRVVDKGEKKASTGFTLRFDVGKKPSHGRARISGAQPGGRLLRLAVWLQSLSPTTGTGKLWAPLAARALRAARVLLKGVPTH